jgi:hypothetical protein
MLEDVAAVPSDEEVRLGALGIHEPDDELEPGVRAECTRIARNLLVGRVRVVGLVPVNGTTAVPPVAVQLGLAVCELSGGTCAVVDANVHWPALSTAILDLASRGGDDTVFATRWLRGQLALLTPHHAQAAGAGLVELGRLIHGSRDLFPVILADLTGFDLLGEHLAAMDLVEGVVMVAPAGKVTEVELLKRQGEVPEHKRLGVLLVGEGSPDARLLDQPKKIRKRRRS